MTRSNVVRYFAIILLAIIEFPSKVIQYIKNYQFPRITAASIIGAIVSFLFFLKTFSLIWGCSIVNMASADPVILAIKSNSVLLILLYLAFVATIFALAFFTAIAVYCVTFPREHPAPTSKRENHGNTSNPKLDTQPIQAA